MEELLHYKESLEKRRKEKESLSKLYLDSLMEVEKMGNFNKETLEKNEKENKEFHNLITQYCYVI